MVQGGAPSHRGLTHFQMPLFPNFALKFDFFLLFFFFPLSIDLVEGEMGSGFIFIDNALKAKGLFIYLFIKEKKIINKFENLGLN